MINMTRNFQKIKIKKIEFFIKNMSKNNNVCNILQINVSRK